MRKAARTRTLLAIALAVAPLLAGRVEAQTPCSRPPLTCPEPGSTNSFVQINLEPSGESCRFNPRIISDLTLMTGDDVHWDFCNACPMDMEIQIDVPGGDGPFNRFQIFSPTATADNLVTIAAPCRAYASATGTNAQSAGDWKYFLRMRLANTTGSIDEIDPRLEIDEVFFTVWLERIAWVLLGVALGFVAFRRRALQR